MKIVITKGGLGLGSLASLVTLAFVIAKLTGAIDWSWLVVFSPVLAYMALGAVITICVLLVIGIGLLLGYSKLKKFLKGWESKKYADSQPEFTEAEDSSVMKTEDLSVMTDITSQSESKTAKLYEKRGKTSRYIDVEINKDGDIVVTGQDIGKLPKEFWGDSDYEFFVFVPASYKDDVYRVLLEKLRIDNPKAVNRFSKSGSTDDAILALVKKLYAGNPNAVDQFKDYMRSQGIPAEFDSWA